MKRILVAYSLLLVSSVTALTQTSPTTVPSGNVVVSPELYSAIWNFLVQTECKNPLQILNALAQARQVSETHTLKPAEAPTQPK